MTLEAFRKRHPHAEIIKMLETTGTDELGPYVSTALIVSIPGFEHEDLNAAVMELDEAGLLDDCEHVHTREHMIGLKERADRWFLAEDAKWAFICDLAADLNLKPQWLANSTKEYRLVNSAGTIVATGPRWRILEYLLKARKRKLG